MKIAYLGAGAWGFCLANLLAGKGYEVDLWTGNPKLVDALRQGESHPKLRDAPPEMHLSFTTDLEKALDGADIIIESVTSKGLRPVLEKVFEIGSLEAPLVITSKGIEQNTGLLLSEVAIDVLGKECREKIGCLSGPSLASEVTKKLPTSVVASAYDHEFMRHMCDIFSTPFFRVYPNSDMAGVSFGGAMKNIIAIACAIADGLGFGENTKAALMTRGLHEIRKLSVTKGCKPETLNGLAGMGDLCATCLSTASRNYIFGTLIASGLTPKEAQEKIGMVVEGAYTCVSARQLSQKSNIPVPITEAVYSIIYENLNPKEAVETLLGRVVKEEHL